MAGAAAASPLDNGVEIDILSLPRFFSDNFENLKVVCNNQSSPSYTAYLQELNTIMRMPIRQLPSPGTNTIMVIKGNIKGLPDIFPLAALSIRSGFNPNKKRVIHEIYSLSTSTRYRLWLENTFFNGIPDPSRSSISNLLLKYTLTFHNIFKLKDDATGFTYTPETLPVLYWVPIQTEDFPPIKTGRIIRLFTDAGFFFPTVISQSSDYNTELYRTYVNNSKKTLLGGIDVSKSIICGYWSKSIQEYNAKYEMRTFNPSVAMNALIGTQKDYAMLSREKREHSGFLNVKADERGDDRGELEELNQTFIEALKVFPPEYAIDGHAIFGGGGSYYFKDIRRYAMAPAGNFFRNENNPFTRFHYHIHPLVCHINTNIARGFPSQQDIFMLFSASNKDLNVNGFMVFSREGAWLIRMNPYLTYLKYERPNKYEQYREVIDVKVVAVMNMLESLRLYANTRNYTEDEIKRGVNSLVNITSLNEPSADDFKQIGNYLRVANNSPLYEIDGIEMSPFSIQYIKRNNIEERFVYLTKKF